MKTKLSILFVLMFALSLGLGCKGKKDKKDKNKGTDNEPKVTNNDPTKVQPKPAGPSQYWKGELQVPGLPLKIGVTLTKGADGKYTGKYDMPARNVVGMELKKVTLENNKLSFLIWPPGMPQANAARADVVIEGNKAKGTFVQGPAKLPLTMEKVATKAELPQPWKRPQTPKPPFPYASREVLYDNPTDKSKIGGTLTFPKTGGPFPAVLLITGSGAQDRDETIFNHKPFAVIADHLSRNGFAVLRVDDRGVGKTTGAVATATIQTHVTDVEAGVAFLAKQKEVDPKRIGLIGHSEGGIIAPIVASKNKNVAFIVSLAGTGLPGSIISPMQIEAIIRGGEEKLTDEQIKELVDHQKKLMKLIQKDAKLPALVKQIRASYDSIQKMKIKAAPQTSMTPAQLDQTAKTEAMKVGSAWFRSFVKTDPAKYWKKVKVPVLALNGEKDTQVPHKENLGAIKAALEAGGNKDYTVKKLDNLNHLFQVAKTGLLDEYPELTETFNKDALKVMSDWLTSKAKR